MTGLFEKLTIRNNFIFGAVMQNPRRCKAFLECVLGIKIKHIGYPNIEKDIDNAYDAKSVRLDVYVEDNENTVFNIEMQNATEKNLPKRMRYYQGMIDLSIINKGEPYNNLRKSYVIFICDFDWFGLGRYVYTFENRCIEEPKLRLADDTVKVVLNTKGTVGEVNDDLKALLEYIGGSLPSSQLAKELDEEVENVRASKEWRRRYMTLLMRDNENIEKGRLESIISLIRKTHNKHMSAEEIAELFEMDLSEVQDIVRLIKDYPQENDAQLAERKSENVPL